MKQSKNLSKRWPFSSQEMCVARVAYNNVPPIIASAFLKWKENPSVFRKVSRILDEDNCFVIFFKRNTLVSRKVSIFSGKICPFSQCPLCSWLVLCLNTTRQLFSRVSRHRTAKVTARYRSKSYNGSNSHPKAGLSWPMAYP